MQGLLARHLGHDWTARVTEPDTWARLDQVPDAALWQCAGRCGSSSSSGCASAPLPTGSRAGRLRLRRSPPPRAFDPDTLTIGFARRLATYKRLHLITSDLAARSGYSAATGRSDPARGKAHPQDDGAKRIVQALFQAKGAPLVGERIAYLHDYDMEIASFLVAGCDVWSTSPPAARSERHERDEGRAERRPQPERARRLVGRGYDGTNGWAIDGAVTRTRRRRRRHAQALLDVSSARPSALLRTRRRRVAAGVAGDGARLHPHGRAPVLRSAHAGRLRVPGVPRGRGLRAAARTLREQQAREPEGDEAAGPGQREHVGEDQRGPAPAAVSRAITTMVEVHCRANTKNTSSDSATGSVNTGSPCPDGRPRGGPPAAPRSRPPRRPRRSAPASRRSPRGRQAGHQPDADLPVEASGAISGSIARPNRAAALASRSARAAAAGARAGSGAALGTFRSTHSTTEAARMIVPPLHERRGAAPHLAREQPRRRPAVRWQLHVEHRHRPPQQRPVEQRRRPERGRDASR